MQYAWAGPELLQPFFLITRVFQFAMSINSLNHRHCFSLGEVRIRVEALGDEEKSTCHRGCRRSVAESGSFRTSNI
jgi:hypothetical protein